MVDIKKKETHAKPTNNASPVENCSGSIEGQDKGDDDGHPDREGDVEGDGEGDGVVVLHPFSDTNNTSNTQSPGSLVAIICSLEPVYPAGGHATRI